MIAISSCRPMGDDAYSRNQLTAWQSWQTAFDAVVYFNHPQPQLQSPTTRFIPWEPFPSILQMAELAAEQTDWACILNADIVVAPHFRAVERRLKEIGATAASSWRWQFDPWVGTSPSRVVDNGLDFFAAHRSIWLCIARLVPHELRLGCQRWDSWMLGAFNTLAGGGLVGITKHKVILHPMHGDRNYGGEIPEVNAIGSPYFPRELPR